MSRLSSLVTFFLLLQQSPLSFALAEDLSFTDRENANTFASLNLKDDSISKIGATPVIQAVDQIETRVESGTINLAIPMGEIIGSIDGTTVQGAGFEFD